MNDYWIQGESHFQLKASSHTFDMAEAKSITMSIGTIPPKDSTLSVSPMSDGRRHGSLWLVQCPLLPSAAWHPSPPDLDLNSSSSSSCPRSTTPYHLITPWMQNEILHRCKGQVYCTPAAAFFSLSS